MNNISSMFVLALILITGISLISGSFCIEKTINASAEESTPTVNSTVVLELFTETWCGPCKNSDLATDKLREDYSNEELVILEFHYDQNGDPFFTDETNYRFNQYYDFDSWPSAMFDGHLEKVGSGDIDEIYAEYKENVESRLQDKSHFFITITNTNYQKDSGYVSAYIAERTDSKRSNLTIFTVIFRDKLHFDGGNGIIEHRYVVRNLISERFKGPTQAVEYNYTLPNDSQYLKSGDNLGIVVFVQDDDTKEIVQADMRLLYTEDGDTTQEESGAEESGLHREQVILGASGLVVVLIGMVGHIIMKSSKRRRIEDIRRTHTHTRPRLSPRNGLSRKKVEFVSCPECSVKVKKRNLDSHLERVHYRER